MAAIGLSAIIATSAVAFSIIKWAGVLYLIWLGYQAFRSSTSSSSSETDDSPSAPSSGSVFVKGALISALNPKVALFFLAFLPQFVVEGAGPVPLQLLFHGVLLIGIGLFLQTPIILLGSRVTSALGQNRTVRHWFDRCLGAMYIAIGARLAISKID